MLGKLKSNESPDSQFYNLTKVRKQGNEQIVYSFALVRDFNNEIINDEDNHDIPDFWGECHDKDLVTPIRNLRPEGKRDLYGLCTPTVQGKDTFAYGIGVIVDQDTAPYNEGEMTGKGYTIWDVEPGTYVVLIAKVKMETVSVKLGANSTKSFFLRLVTNPATQQTMKFISKKDEKDFSVSCGFR